MPTFSFTLIVIAVVTIIVGVYTAKIKWSQREARNLLVKLSRHLNSLGIETALPAESDEQPRIEKRDVWKYSCRSTDILKIKGNNINYIFIDCVIGKNMTLYYLNYVFESSHLSMIGRVKAVRLVKDRDFLLVGKIRGVEWRGDKSLSGLLNNDLSLKDKLVTNPDINKLTHNIVIYPKANHGYYKIRIRYFLPQSGFLEALNTIGKHLKEYS